MGADVEKWILIVHDAWNRLLDDFESIGSRSGYYHIREEDLRSYLFCKIREVIREKREYLIELHADIPLPKKRVDIVLGYIDENSWKVGVEIKQSGQYKPLTSDLNKLSTLIEDGRLKSGMLVAIVKHWDDWKPIFEAWDLAERFKLEPEDNNKNNYWKVRELREIPIENKTMMLDSLLFVLRKL